MSFMLRVPFSLVAALAALLGFAGSGEAAFLGDTIKPFISVAGIYDSNLFRVKDSAQLKAAAGDGQLGDFITMLDLGTRVHHSLGRQEFNLLLKKDFQFYAHYTGQDTDNEEVSGDLSLVFLDALRIRVDGDYSTAPESRVDYRNIAVNERTTLTGGISLGYQTPSGLAFEASYRYYEVDYSLEAYKPNEYSRNTYAGKISYRISENATAYASYQRDNTDYPHDMKIGALPVNNSSAADSFRVGLEKVVSPKTVLSCYVGYLDRRHQQASARDFSGVIGKVEAKYAVTDKIGLMLNFERQLYEETYIDRIYSVTDAFGLALSYAITEKIKATLFNRLSWKEFQDLPGSGVARRNDFLHEINSEVEWQPINRFSVILAYQYSTRRSDDNTLNFNDHMVITSIGYKY